MCPTITSLESGWPDSWKKGAAGEACFTQWDCIWSQAVHAPQTWVLEQTMITLMPHLKGSVLLVLRWILTYLSSDWVVRLGVTSWMHKWHVGLNCSWSTMNSPVWRRLKCTMVRQPIRLVVQGTDVVVRLTLGDHKWRPAYNTLGLTECVWPWGISIALRPLWVHLASPCWCGVHAPHISSWW